jgi:hypothetical protein
MLSSRPPTRVRKGTTSQVIQTPIPTKKPTSLWNLNSPNQDEAGAQPDNSLARSLELLATNIASLSAPPKPKSNIKPRTPDIFDGTDPAKVDTFTFQCSMYFTACSSDFLDEESRVTFALSYLKGIPLDWFQAELSRAINDNEDYSEWYFSYADFVADLQKNFGSCDPVTDATNALKVLRYKDLTKAACYTIEFNHHAYHTGWNDIALTCQYYKGLSEHFKDDVSGSQIGKPGTLKLLQELVAMLDQRYWERQSEFSQDR